MFDYNTLLRVSSLNNYVTKITITNKKIFERAGFKKRKIEVGNFKVPLLFEYLKFDLLKKIAAFLASKIEFFWPMMYIKAEK